MGIDITSGAGACLEDFGFTDALIGSGPPSLSQIIMVCSGIPVLFRIFPPFSLPSYGVLLKFTCHYSLFFLSALQQYKFLILSFFPKYSSELVHIHTYVHVYNVHCSASSVLHHNCSCYPLWLLCVGLFFFPSILGLVQCRRLIILFEK